MIIEELTHDDIIYVIEHLQANCECREDCNGCHYTDMNGECTISCIPEEWRPEAIKKGGDDE